ncbi:unnamed protein product [Leptosia nina]|uniref:Uncharacterized protein n=1 Tax=Leptosia nina TaxID=320188 RepID=A0AAV1K0S2_9NEOP
MKLPQAYPMLQYFNSILLVFLLPPRDLFARGPQGCSCALRIQGGPGVLLGASASRGPRIYAGRVRGLRKLVAGGIYHATGVGVPRVTGRRRGHGRDKSPVSLLLLLLRPRGVEPHGVPGRAKGACGPEGHRDPRRPAQPRATMGASQLLPGTCGASFSDRGGRSSRNSRLSSGAVAASCESSPVCISGRFGERGECGASVGSRVKVFVGCVDVLICFGLLVESINVPFATGNGSSSSAKISCAEWGSPVALLASLRGGGGGGGHTPPFPRAAQTHRVVINIHWLRYVPHLLGDFLADTVSCNDSKIRIQPPVL